MYFQALCKATGKEVPEWSSFNPMEVASILPWITMIERKDDSLAGHHCRLIGEKIIQLLGKNFTGYSLDQVLTGEDSHTHWDNLKAVVAQREPSYIKTVIPVKNKDFKKIYRGCFPFSDDAKKIIRLIIIVDTY
ncbi:MAG: PAS domain-containing protein [Emcibacteraceae bacterium]|nr:PAS domain-containing protein [Emcibacteraceae bacterium]